jgi:diketogulonate reductase-like aldo/keto reductase
VIDPFSDTGQEGDDRDRQTQRCTLKTVDKSGQPYSAFQRFLVRGGTHAIPDASECDRVDNNFMTCDYDYTEQTIRFFQQYAELGLNP